MYRFILFLTILLMTALAGAPLLRADGDFLGKQRGDLTGGTAGQALISNGPGLAPSWGDVSAGNLLGTWSYNDAATAPTAGNCLKVGSLNSGALQACNFGGSHIIGSMTASQFFCAGDIDAATTVTLKLESSNNTRSATTVFGSCVLDGADTDPIQVCSSAGPYTTTRVAHTFGGKNYSAWAIEVDAVTGTGNIEFTCWVEVQ